MIDGWPVRLADKDDLDEVVNTLNESGSRLALRGLDQWGHNWMPAERMAETIRRVLASQAGATVVHGVSTGSLWVRDAFNGQ